MKLGDMVFDYALDKNGVVVSGPFTEERGNLHSLNWEWLVLYCDGELMGADTNDLAVVNED